MSCEPRGTDIPTANMPCGRLQHEMTDLEDKIAWHYAQIAILKAQRNSLAPIYSLPNELLCRIFIFYAVASDSLFNLKWTQIMYVCHLWHDLAMATQPLWACIEIGWEKHRIERFYGQLARSGAAPLTLKINPFLLCYTPAILKHAGRILGLKIRGEAKHMYELIRSLPDGHFPVLSSIDFDLTYKRDELPEGYVEAMPDEVFDGRMPQLQELVLDSIALPWKSVRGLTTLCLENCGNTGSPHTFKGLLEMLAACPLIHTLKLDNGIPAPLPDQAYRTVNLPMLAGIHLHDAVTTCTVVLNHLRFPPNTSIHIFPYGVQDGPDVSNILIPVRKHLRARGAPTPLLMHIEASVRSDRLHCKTSLFGDTTSPNPLDPSEPCRYFTLNSLPTQESGMRRIMTKVFKAIPVASITKLDARMTTMTSTSWKAALRLLPALEEIHLIQRDDSAVSLFDALNHIEQLDRDHRIFPRIQRVQIRLFRRWASRGESEPTEDLVAVLLTPLQIYLRAALDAENPLKVLELDDMDHRLAYHEPELDQLFTLVGDRMVWNSVVYDPAIRKAEQEAWDAERRALDLEDDVVESTSP
ncbi:hypothetical protein C8R43DRAFT_1102379 [Mycena crocata]|nr:hypothetical protein C8R43DRAFT_1102379 [Mycena crocata]